MPTEAPAKTGARGIGALRYVAYLAVAVPLVRLAYGTLKLPVGPSLTPWMGIPVIAVLLALTWALLRRERRSPAEFGLRISRQMVKHLVCGFAAGLFLLGAGALLMRGVLPFTWRVNPAILPTAVLGGLLFNLITNTCEELAWRGYAFDGLLRLYGHWPAQVIVAVTAAYFHVLSGWSWSVALTSTIAGSVLFALVFLRWRSIPAAIGVHVGWNWARDLLLSPDSPASLWVPQGMETWTSAQWRVAQASLILVTVVASIGLLRFRQGVRVPRTGALP